MGIITIKEILEVKPYYNIGILLMIEKGQPQHAMKIFGEQSAFEQFKEAKNWYNELRAAANHLNYPMGLNLSKEILRPHYHVTACILAGFKDTSYMTCREPTPDYGENWLGDYPEKDKIIEFYRGIPELFGIN